MGGSQERPYDHVHVVVVDGMGCGQAKDVETDYPEDIGVNSLANASRVRQLHAPHLQGMGLEYVPGLESLQVQQHVGREDVKGAFGIMEPTFKGNGSPEGHQALMGHVVKEPYLLFDKTGFPDEIVELVEKQAAAVMGREARVIRYPGTDDINGVKFINHQDIGQVHVASKDKKEPLVVPIYASSDSLVQIALHQEIVSQEDIERIGKAVREALNRAGLRVARVIMRPFIGTGPDKFERVSKDRKDYGVDPDEKTLINRLTEAEIPVYGIGKAADMLNYYGFPAGSWDKGKDDEGRLKRIYERVRDIGGPAFGFTNLVSTDEHFGHPRKPKEYAEHVMIVDRWIGEIVREMSDRVLLVITADHGNDPTQTRHTNHTRENVPVLVYSRKIAKPIELGIRTTYADLAKTIAENFGVQDKLVHGRSFLSMVS